MNIDNLVEFNQFKISYNQKIRMILNVIESRLPLAGNNPRLKRWLQKINLDINRDLKIDSLCAIPFIPVQMFKEFDLSFSNYSNKSIQSSGTTSSLVSKVSLNSETAKIQIKGLSSILESFLGGSRLAFLVLDYPESIEEESAITARAAGIRGLGIFAKKTYFLLERDKCGRVRINWAVIDKILDEDHSQHVYAFGFTYIIWSELLNYGVPSEKLKKLKSLFKKITLFHSGGWKKLQDSSVSSESFNYCLKQVFGDNTEIVNFYGMAEQGGAIFTECIEGYKHVPNFSSIIIRDPFTLKCLDNGKEGLIQVINTLPTSYYGYGTLTEDIGIIDGIDDCPCGRLGERFRFLRRMDRTEIRGCGDTYKKSPAN